MEVSAVFDIPILRKYLIRMWICQRPFPIKPSLGGLPKTSLVRLKIAAFEARNPSHRGRKHAKSSKNGKPSPHFPNDQTAADRARQFDAGS